MRSQIPGQYVVMTFGFVFVAPPGHGHGQVRILRDAADVEGDLHEVRSASAEAGATLGGLLTGFFQGHDPSFKAFQGLREAGDLGAGAVGPGLFGGLELEGWR